MAETFNYHNLTVDGAGNIYMSSYIDDVVLMQPYGTSTKASRITIARVGLAMNEVQDVRGLCTDAAGFLYIADFHNYRIQRYSPTLAVILDQPVETACANPGSAVSAQVNADAFPPLTYQWYKNNLTTPVVGQTSRTLLLTKQ